MCGAHECERDKEVHAHHKQGACSVKALPDTFFYLRYPSDCLHNRESHLLVLRAHGLSCLYCQDARAPAWEDGNGEVDYPQSLEPTLQESKLLAEGSFRGAFAPFRTGRHLAAVATCN